MSERGPPHDHDIIASNSDFASTLSRNGPETRRRTPIQRATPRSSQTSGIIIFGTGNPRACARQTGTDTHGTYSNYRYFDSRLPGTWYSVPGTTLLAAVYEIRAVPYLFSGYEEEESSRPEVLYYSSYSSRLRLSSSSLHLAVPG